jgi:cell division transport system ATP-binding protein
VSVIFQDFKLLPQKTVFENVAFALEVSGHTRHDVRRLVPETLDLVGLAHYVDRFPHDLSGGEQQRVAIARALANRPIILLADEPTGNLDSATGAEVMRLLRDLNADGLTLILVTHDASVAAYANRIVRLRDGKVAGIEQASEARDQGPELVAPLSP